MDEPTELLVETVKSWTSKYAHKIYVKEKDAEKKEHHYDVVFFQQKQNEPIPECTINVHFVLTELETFGFGGDDSPSDLKEKYFITFQFEHENLTRTLDMHLNFEKWIDKLIKDKEKLRKRIDLSSVYMKSRFVKPLDESGIQQILNKIKDEREAKRANENDLQKKKRADEVSPLEDKKKATIAEKREEEKKEQLDEALMFLRNILLEHLMDIDSKKKGKVKYDIFVEILKMINYEMYLSFIYAKEETMPINKEKYAIFEKALEKSFSIDDPESTASNSSDDSSKEGCLNRQGEQIYETEKRIGQNEKKYLSSLFHMNNKEIDLIKSLNIYKNTNFNGFDVFSKLEDITSVSVTRNGNHYVFEKVNPYYQYLYTDNPYDFLLYIAYAHEDDLGWVHYKNCLNVLTTYLYKINKNRELYQLRSLDELTAYKQYMYVCYENELNFMNNTLIKQLQKYDSNESGYIHRNKLKSVLQENDHIISKQEYKLLLRALNFNDDNYVYYKNFTEIILRLRFEGIKNSIFERDEKLLLKYLCEELVEYNYQNKKKLHIFDCKNILDVCDKIYLNKNTIHVILSSLNFDENLELDTTVFLQVCVTIIVNMVKLETMQMIHNVLVKEKEKKDKSTNGDSTIVYKKKKGSKQMEKVNVPALELVERTLTKLFKVLDEKNEDLLEINDFIKIMLESNKKRKIIDIKEICKFNKSELQGFVAEINTQPLSPFHDKNMKSRGNIEYYKNKKIHYPSHIHKWCSKTYQIGSCYYYSYFLNYPEPFVELDNNITKSLFSSDETRGD